MSEWRVVAGTDGRYVVAVDGRIGRARKSVDLGVGIADAEVDLLDCARGVDRWRRVRIRMHGGKLFQRRVAELVAAAWLLDGCWRDGDRVVFREGAYDPARGDHAGTLDVVDRAGRSRVGAEGRKVWEAWGAEVEERVSECEGGGEVKTYPIVTDGRLCRYVWKGLTPVLEVCVRVDKRRNGRCFITMMNGSILSTTGIHNWEKTDEAALAEFIVGTCLQCGYGILEGDELKNKLIAIADLLMENRK